MAKLDKESKEAHLKSKFDLEIKELNFKKQQLEQEIKFLEGDLASLKSSKKEA